MNYLLGIDIGTSSAKALLFDVEQAQIRAVAGREYPIYRPAPDQALQKLDDWWAATVEVTRRVTAEGFGEAVAAISFSGQMHGTSLFDADGRELHPAIIWADQRTGQEVTELSGLLGAEAYAAIAGTLPAAGFQAATLLWLLKHQPELLEQAAFVLPPKDAVRFRMTGEAAVDVSDAAGTGIFDVSRRDWAWTIIQKAGLPEHIFPPVKASTAVAGYLLRGPAEEMGLRPGIPVVAGCADQPAQAVGNGLIRPGRGSVTVGSGGQVFIPFERPLGGRVPTDSRLHVFNHAVPDQYFVLGATLSAGLSLRWLRGIVGLEGDPEAYAKLSTEAAAIPPGAEGLLFLPHLAGERTPHMDSLARGTFVGLSAHHTRGHLARAIMEGVAFSLRQAVEISRELGAAADTMIAAGGGGESDIWRGIQADVYGLPLQRTLSTEQASLGAALVAGVGAGVYHSLNEACERVVRYGAITEPDSARHAFYEDVYAQYLELYPRLREDFHRLARRSL